LAQDLPAYCDNAETLATVILRSTFAASTPSLGSWIAARWETQGGSVHAPRVNRDAFTPQGILTQGKQAAPEIWTQVALDENAADMSPVSRTTRPGARLRIKTRADTRQEAGSQP
jgi:hypothetical protein